MKVSYDYRLVVVVVVAVVVAVVVGEVLHQQSDATMRVLDEQCHMLALVHETLVVLMIMMKKKKRSIL
jgi:hypothetical protein